MKIFFLFTCYFTVATVASQPSDFIVLKKGDRTIKSLFAGSMIGFKTINGYYYGKIITVKKDSLFINQYDVRQVPTNLGVYMLDTIATYRLGFNYHDLVKIENLKRKGFNWAASGGSLFGGGVLLTTLGLGTWIFTKPGTQYHAGTPLIAGSAALASIGYLLMKSNSAYYNIGEKYQLQYITVK